MSLRTLPGGINNDALRVSRRIHQPGTGDNRSILNCQAGRYNAHSDTSLSRRRSSPARTVVTTAEITAALDDLRNIEYISCEIPVLASMGPFHPVAHGD